MSGIKKEDKTKAIFFMLLSALGFSLMNLSVRLAGNLPTLQKSFFRNFVVFFIALLLCFFHRRRKTAGAADKNGPGVATEAFLRRKRRVQDFLFLFFRSAFGLIGILANFYALDHLSIAEASVFNKTAPFFVLLFSFFFLGEKVRLYQWTALGAAFSGVLVISASGISSPGEAQFHSYLIALAGGMGAGAAYTLVRVLGQRGVSSHLIICFFSGFSTLAILPRLLCCWQAVSTLQLLILFAAGAAAALGQYGVTCAYRFAAARDVSIYDYSTVLFSAFLSLLFLGEKPGANLIVGAAIIFSAALFMFCRQKKERSEPRVC